MNRKQSLGRFSGWLTRDINWKKTGITAGLLGIAYIGTFCLLAARGGYRTNTSGDYRPILFATHDRWVWQPRYGEFSEFHTISGKTESHADLLGCLFEPLIRFQQWRHPEIRFLPSDKADAMQPTEEQLHPVDREIGRIQKEFWDAYGDEYNKARESGDHDRTAEIRKQFSETLLEKSSRLK